MKNKFPYRYRVMIMLFFLILITYFDRVCISLVGVRIKAEFNLSNQQFGWVVGAFALAYALFEIPGGIWGDKFGQRKVLIRIVIWWSLFTALTGLTMGLLSLVIIRFLFGAGEAGAFPNGTGVISRWFPAAETSKGISALLVGQSSGAAIAPLIIIPLAAAYGWRIPFFASGAIGLVWVAVCYTWYKNHPAEMKGISQAEKNLIENNRCFSNHNNSGEWKLFLKQKNVWLLMLSFFCSQWALYFFVAWMPVYLQQGRHFSEDEMKATTSFLFLCGISGGLSAGIINDWLVKKKGVKFGRRLMGFISMGIMSLLFLIAATTSNNNITSAAFIFCYPFLPVYCITALSTCVDIGGNKACTIAGFMNCAGQIGAFFLAIFFGNIVDLTNNYNAPLFVIAGVLISGSVLWLNVNPEKKIVANTTIENKSFIIKPVLIADEVKVL